MRPRLDGQIEDIDPDDVVRLWVLRAFFLYVFLSTIGFARCP